MGTQITRLALAANAVERGENLDRVGLQVIAGTLGHKALTIDAHPSKESKGLTRQISPSSATSTPLCICFYLAATPINSTRLSNLATTSPS